MQKSYLLSAAVLSAVFIEFSCVNAAELPEETGDRTIPSGGIVRKARALAQWERVNLSMAMATVTSAEFRTKRGGDQLVQAAMIFFDLGKKSNSLVYLDSARDALLTALVTFQHLRDQTNITNVKAKMDEVDQEIKVLEAVQGR